MSNQSVNNPQTPFAGGQGVNPVGSAVQQQPPLVQPNLQAQQPNTANIQPSRPENQNTKEAKPKNRGVRMIIFLLLIMLIGNVAYFAYNEVNIQSIKNRLDPAAPQEEPTDVPVSGGGLNVVSDVPFLKENFTRYQSRQFRIFFDYMQSRLGKAFSLENKVECGYPDTRTEEVRFENSNIKVFINPCQLEIGDVTMESESTTNSISGQNFTITTYQWVGRPDYVIQAKYTKSDNTFQTIIIDDSVTGADLPSKTNLITEIVTNLFIQE